METKTLPIEATEAIAMTEKKMDMSLDEIIKMSKKNSSKGSRPPRQPVKGQGFRNGTMPQRNSKVQRFTDSRSSMRQGALAQRRSNFHGNHFPLTKDVTKKAAAMPIGNRMLNFNRTRFPAAANENPTYRRRQILQKKTIDGGSVGKIKTFTTQKPQTLDELFASMKQQRMRTISQQSVGGQQSAQRRRSYRMQWNLGGAGGAAHHSGNFIR